MIWNPRYVAYATSNGRDPQAQLDADKEAWPGGRMAPFMFWISAQIRAFREVARAAFDVHGRLTDNDAFGRWLETGRVP